MVNYVQCRLMIFEVQKVEIILIDRKLPNCTADKSKTKMAADVDRFRESKNK